ncbi:MAG: TIGR04222 domain-containing membrane protein [Acidimicrobiales bacterium]
MFLVLYAVLLALSVGLVAAARWRRRVPAPPTVDPDMLDDYDVAMLNGGGQLVAVVGLLNLRQAGVVELGDDLIRELAGAHGIDESSLTPPKLKRLGVEMRVGPMGPLPSDSHPVEAAVHETVVASEVRAPHAIVSAAAGSRAVAGVHERLAGPGLMLGADELRRRKWEGLWLLPVGLLGLLRLGVGLERDKPVGFLISSSSRRSS